VHLAQWHPSEAAVSASEQNDLERLFEIRQRVLPCLEKERQSKVIGKALDARVTLAASASENLPVRDADQEPLRELLNVSQLVIRPPPAQGGSFTIEVSKAGGQKCERCWHWEMDVGNDPSHPALCARCAAVVKDLPA
jgi:isoleucyl-tRNA synthetase